MMPALTVPLGNMPMPLKTLVKIAQTYANHAVSTLLHPKLSAKAALLAAFSIPQLVFAEPNATPLPCMITKRQFVFNVDLIST